MKIAAAPPVRRSFTSWKVFGGVDPVGNESVSKVDFLTPKAFHNSAQGNTLGLGRAFEPTLKALNNDPMHPASDEFLNPYRVINPSGSLIPGCYPGLS
jgi:hypothetical protein